MTSTQSSGPILKTDSLARVRTPQQRKRELLEEFERSGLSGVKFAALSGVKYSTFAGWVARGRRTRPVEAPPPPAAKPVDPVRWLEAVVDRAHTAAGQKPPVLTIYFSGGARAEIADAKQGELAAAVLRSLNQPAPLC
jgi:hypothetical protein